MLRVLLTTHQTSSRDHSRYTRTSVITLRPGLRHPAMYGRIEQWMSWYEETQAAFSLFDIRHWPQLWQRL